MIADLFNKLLETVFEKITKQYKLSSDITIKYINDFQRDDGLYDIFFIDEYYTLVNDYKEDYRIELINNSDKTISDIYITNENNNRKLKIKSKNIDKIEVKPNSKVVIQIKPLDNIEECIIYYSINQGVSYIHKRIKIN